MKQNKTEQKKEDKETKKGVKKKETKKDLIEGIREHKKQIQKMRFSLSGESRQKEGERRKLRKEIARAATRLTALAKEKASTKTSK